MLRRLILRLPPPMRVEPFPEDSARVEHLDGASLERGLVSHTARLDCFLHGWGRKEVGGGVRRWG